MASVALMWFPLPGAGLPAPLRVTYGLLASESRCLSRKHVSRFRDKLVATGPADWPSHCGHRLGKVGHMAMWRLLAGADLAQRSGSVACPSSVGFIHARC